MLESEANKKRYGDGRVESKEQYHPVPSGLEAGVMQNNPGWGVRHVKFVIW